MMQTQVSIPDEEAVIHYKNVVQRRAHFQLGPLQLGIPQGCITAIVGPNGSGKSSTFRLLLDLAKPDSGEIEVFGRKAAGPDDLAIKQQIGYLPEEPGYGEDGMRGSEKAAFVKAWYPSWDVNRYQELLRYFEVDPSMKLGKMSKGMRRKFDMTLALAHHPKLLLLDEPSSGLDPLAWKKMIELLHQMMETGECTILMTTHIIDEVRRLADYIVFMVNGRVLGFYEKDELLGSWHQLYIHEQPGVYELLAELPGLQRKERIGGMIRAVTNQALLAEEWLSSRKFNITNQARLELDDIMGVLIENDRLQARQ